MLSVSITGPRQSEHLEHVDGPLEFGRGPRRQSPRLILEDPYVSRDHLRIEELPDGRVRLENLSQRKDILLGGGSALTTGTSQVHPLPLRLKVGETLVEVTHQGPGTPADTNALQTICLPAIGEHFPSGPRRLGELGDSPAPEMLAHWLETVIALEQSAAGPAEFHSQTARALVELVGLDQGLVLLCQDSTWTAVARYPEGGTPRFSHTLLNQVVRERRTFYQDPTLLPERTESLCGIGAVVASPIFGLRQEVAGVLFGLRQLRPGGIAGIRPLEAQVVQLLAAAAGANLARSLAIRTRVQFEQFFSPELVRELERDPGLLEGRNQEVTVLVSDLRGFTRLSERLGPQTTCRLIRDMMERLSERIAEQGGVIVDYAGDGILAMWNAPLPQPDHATRACRAALAMRDELPGLNSRWQAVVGNPLALGIGLNTGPAQVGNTGCSRKLKYGPHGYTVNLASRVQDATRKVGAAPLLTGPTRDKLPDTFDTTLAGRVPLAGVEGDVALYELHGERS